MRLSKIRLSGFKSFVDPTSISFPGNLTGIVGPNGCGKSNVIDAIRWVLGEGSAKTLRGDSMADVIFNGTSDRKPVGQASVELYFDNSDGTIGGAYAGYSEVSVRRAVSRDGTSQFFLNNARCRRKDITNLLLGTGVGAHGYSIIEQGMISRLVEARPEELRAFLEEAAGISKYKERRRETEHKVRHTRENLERLGDLRDEVDKQLAHLKRQARAAERYRTLKEEERRTQAEVLALTLRGLRADVAEREQALGTKQLAFDAAETGQRSIETEIEKLRVEEDERGEAFQAVHGARLRLDADIGHLEDAIRHRKATASRLDQDLNDATQELQELSGHIEGDTGKIERFDRTLNELAPEFAAAGDRQRESDDTLRRAEEELERFRERWEQVAAELADTRKDRELGEAQLEHLDGQRERLQGRLRDSAAERDAAQFAEHEEELAQLADREAKLGAASAEALASVAALAERIRRQRGEERRIFDELDEAREQLQGERERLSSLEALQEAVLGNVPAAVDGWLEKHSVGGARLAEELAVTAGWERAVETVLGDALQAVAVENIDKLADAIAEIADGPLVLVEERSLTGGAEDRGQLLDKVQSPGAAAALLDGVRTADSLAEALKLRPTLEEGQSAITPDGIWVGRYWLRVHRGNDSQLGVIARSDEIAELRDDVASLTRRAQELTGEHAAARSRFDELEAEHAAAQIEANRSQQTHSASQTELEAARARLEQMRDRKAELDRGIAESAVEQKSLTEQIHECRERLAASVARCEELLGSKAQLEHDGKQCRERVLEARTLADSDRSSAQEIALRMESARSSKDAAADALSRVRVQQHKLTERHAQLMVQIDETRAPLPSEETRLSDLLDRRLTVEGQLAEAREAVESVNERLREAESRRGAQELRVNEARGEIEQARLGVREAEVRAESVREQFDDSGFDLEDMLGELPDEENATERAELLERIGKRIARLGAINLAAIDEFEQQSERKQYLDRQFTDLSSALETLESAIGKIDRQTKARFKTTFDKANMHLGALFPRLFNGGHAFLELTGSDLLNSGVTIMARPPGKRINTIQALSGGEKALTAVALVFAIFELNPAPFCLLDEVDAPLDDTNISRFSELVKDMADRIQFVLITHNKATMDTMYQLIGVTMSEPGVSRLVAVDIDEAARLAAM